MPSPVRRGVVGVVGIPAKREDNYLAIPAAAPVALPVAAAAGGAALGALLWAGIAYATGFEIGYVAWALGGLAGGGAVLAGGRGVVCAAAAALLALVGIGFGKFLGFRMLVGHQIEQVAANFDRRAFDELRNRSQAANAAEAAEPAVPAGEMRALADEDAGEGDAAGAEASDESSAPVEVSPEQRRQFEEFLADQAQMQSRLRDPGYTFVQWHDDQVAAMRKQVDTWGLVRESLGPIDLLFVLLGLTTAYGMVMRASSRPTPV